MTNGKKCETLADLIEQAGVSNKSLMTKLRINGAGVTALRAGRFRLPLEKMDVLADVLGLPRGRVLETVLHEYYPGLLGTLRLDVPVGDAQTPSSHPSATFPSFSAKFGSLNIEDAEVQRKLGFSRDQLSRMATGQLIPPIKLCRQLAELFDWTYAETVDAWLQSHLPEVWEAIMHSGLAWPQFAKAPA